MNDSELERDRQQNTEYTQLAESTTKDPKRLKLGEKEQEEAMLQLSEERLHKIMSDSGMGAQIWQLRKSGSASMRSSLPSKLAYWPRSSRT